MSSPSRTEERELVPSVTARALRLSVTTRLRPMEGLIACGDAVIDLHTNDWHLVGVIDALGHGPDAALSASAARRAAEETVGEPLHVVFESVHRALPKMRGVVMSAVLLEGAHATFAGVGNVELFGPEGISRPVSMAGTLGGAPFRFRPFALPMEAGQRWALVSDGIKTREGGAVFAKHRSAPAREAADALLEQASRPHDDVGVLLIDVESAS